MSFIAGIIVATTAACTTAWAVAGDRLAKSVPIVARLDAWLSGGYNMPSDAEVDALEEAAAGRVSVGVADRDELMPTRFGTRTYGEDYESTLLPPCVSEAAIELAPRWLRDNSCTSEDVGGPQPGPGAFTFPAAAPIDGWRGWFAGGYNMPSEEQIDAAYPHTARGLRREPIARSTFFTDEWPGACALPNPTGLVSGHESDARLIAMLKSAEAAVAARKGAT